MIDKTPLELARERLLKPREGSCPYCMKFVVIDDVGYCEESGKMLLELFIDSPRPCCVFTETCEKDERRKHNAKEV